MPDNLQRYLLDFTPDVEVEERLTFMKLALDTMIGWIDHINRKK